MSTFKVQKVTKVKGLADLSSKAQGVEIKDPSTRRTRNSTGASERPQVRSTGKGVSKTDSQSNPGNLKKLSNGGVVKQESSTHLPPKPVIRNKPAQTRRTKDTVDKNCPVQNGRSEPVKQEDGKPKTAAKPTPRPRASPVVPKATTANNLQKTKQSTDRPRPPIPVKKQSSYDASDSDIDGSRDNLVTDGDFGYETGSLDDGDMSGDLLSPAAQDEQKQIGSESVSQLSVSGHKGKIPVPVGKQSCQEDSTSRERQCMSYTYAGDEFRPLIVTEEGGLTAPVKPRKKSEEENQSSNCYDTVETIIPSDGPCRRQRPVMRYEEVEIVDGEYDRSNLAKLAAADVCNSQPVISTQDENKCSVAAGVDSVSYSEIQEVSVSFNDNTKPAAETNEREGKNRDDLYAVVQKKSKPLPKTKKPELPQKPAGRIVSDTYETITDELKDMIEACRTVDSSEQSPSSFHKEMHELHSECKPTLPPRIPKPYSGPGPSAPTPRKKSVPDENVNIAAQHGSDKEEDGEEPPLYAVVQKKPKSNSVQCSSSENLQSTEQKESETEDSGGPPPPLPYRPDFSAETLRKSHSSEDIFQAVAQSEKSKKGGFGIFKKHRRNRSHDMSTSSYSSSSGSDDLSPVNKVGGAIDGLKGPKQHRSRSQGDIMKAPGIDGADAFASLINNDSSTAAETDQTVQIKPYLEVDITDPPSTPEDMKFDPADLELPEGWREVRNENGTYFWHVPTGTTQWERPQMVPRKKKSPNGEARTVHESPETQKVLSFPVHSMGWEELEEAQVAPHNMSDTVAACISSLATKRNDLWNTAETWGEGKDIRLLLEGETLKLVEPRHKVCLLIQPVSKMRVWGVGKEDHRDFAYVARDPNTGKHKCHMFRCHGNISGRAITNALHEMCSRILEEKKRAKHEAKQKSAADKQSCSDIINTPPPPSAKEMTSFNEKPFVEQKKSYTAKYVGNMEVNSPTGIEVLQKAISKVSSKGGPWSTCLVEITISSIKITDCAKHEVITEDRVRFLSFLGVGKDEKFCGYIVTSNPDSHLCHVFLCMPNAATLTKALEEACKLRYQKCLDAHPDASQRLHQHMENEKQNRDRERDKSGFITSVHGFLGKLGPKKGGKKQDDGSSSDSKSGQSGLVAVPTHTFMVKYYGALPVAIGTGIETVQEAAKHLAGGTLLICQLDVSLSGLTLFDSQRSPLSRRHIDADTISYCGLTSTRTHFGLIQSQGGGRYICHVFAEYKTKAGPIVAAIHETL